MIPKFNISKRGISFEGIKGENYSINIVNTQGVLISKNVFSGLIKKLHYISFPNSLASGTYLLTIRSQSLSKSIKFVK